MVDHPLYAMWQERRAVELAEETKRRRRAAERQEAQGEWREVWDAYQRHSIEGRASAPRRPWWHCFRSLALERGLCPGNARGTPRGRLASIIRFLTDP
jgi:hypothetical protein